MKSINIKDRNFLIKVNNGREHENVLERIKELGEPSKNGGLTFTEDWCYIGYYHENHWKKWCLTDGDKNYCKYDYIISYDEFMMIGLKQEYPQYEIY